MKDEMLFLNGNLSAPKETGGPKGMIVNQQEAKINELAFRMTDSARWGAVT